MSKSPKTMPPPSTALTTASLATDPEVLARARRAVKRFRAMQGTLTGFARVLTGDNAVRVEAHATLTATDGKTIYIVPPIELGDDLRHDRKLCDKRDSNDMQMCYACHVHEHTQIDLYHEIAHIAFDSFADMTDADRVDVLRRALEERSVEDGTDRASKIARNLRILGPKRYVEAAALVSPFLLPIVNALEDVRVNIAMYKARPGTLPMFRGSSYDIFENGIDAGTHVVKWADAPINAQAVVALLASAAQYEYHGWFDPSVEEMLDDPQMKKLLRSVRSIRSVRGVYELAYPVLERMRELGFCLAPEDVQDDPEPEPEPEQKSDPGSGGESGEPGTPDLEDDISVTATDADDDAEPDESDVTEDDIDNDERTESEPERDDDSDASDAGEPEQGGDDAEPEQGGDDAGEPDDAPTEPATGSDADDAPTEPAEPTEPATGDDAEPTEPDDAEQGGDDAEPDDAEQGGDDAEPEQGGDDAEPEQGGDDAGDDAEQGGDEPADSDDDFVNDGTQDGDDFDDDDDAEPGDENDGTYDGDDDDFDDDWEDDEPGDGEAGDDEMDGDDFDADPGDDADSDGDDGTDLSDGVDGGLDVEMDAEPGDDASESDDDSDDDAGDAGITAEQDGDRDSDDSDYKDADADSDNAERGERADGEAGESMWSEDGPGGAQPASQPEPDLERDGDADLVERALRVFGGHSDPADEPNRDDESDDDDADEGDDAPGQCEPGVGAAEVARALAQEHMDEASQSITGVRIHEYDKPGTHYMKNNGTMHDASEAGEGCGAWYRTPESRSGYAYTRAVEMPFDTFPEGILASPLMRMRQTFVENRRSKQQRNLKSGSRIDGKVLGRRMATDDPRLFTKTKLPGKKDYFVIIGGDCSGSQLSGDMIPQKVAMWAQAEMCWRTGVPFAMYGHTAMLSDYDDYRHVRSDKYGNVLPINLDIYVIKHEHEPWDDKARQRLFDLGPSGANLDGHTMEWYRKAAQAHRATDKIIMYYTDGEMPAENYDEEVVILEREIKTCKRLGITLMGVGVGTDSPTQYGLDTVQIDDTADVHKVVRHLEKALER